MSAPQDRPSDAELEAVLFPQLQASFRAPPVSGHMRRSPFEYSTSSMLELLSVSFADGRSLDLLFKDLNPRSLLASARGVRPEFLQRPQLEILVYQRLLHGQNMGTANLYATAYEESPGRYWLFIERVVGHPLCHVGDFGAWCGAARWLARIHSFRGGELAQAATGIPLVHYDAPYYERWLRRAEESLGSHCADPAQRPKLERLIASFAMAMPHLWGLETALVHGEYYAANVLVRDGTDGRICPVDWGTAGIGAPGLDLAALTSGKWTDQQRLEMLSAYREALEQTDRPAPALDELLRQEQLCTLFHSLQWVFWADDWQAPLEQRNDWLNAGLIAAERLGL